MITKATVAKYVYKCTNCNAKYLTNLGFKFSSSRDRTFRWEYMEILEGIISGTDYTEGRNIINNIQIKPTTRRKHK